MHPLDRLARSVKATGRRHSQRARAKRFTQGLSFAAALWLAVACQTATAPSPFKIWKTEDPDIIWMDKVNANTLSLRNSDPETYRFRSKIDLSLKPDIL
jgi:hypothetical protein